MEQEIWKDIEDYPIYEVSNIGRIRSIDRIVNCSKGKRTFKGRILSIRKDKKGYCTVNLYKNGRGVPQYVHRLVANAFIPNPNNSPVINHKDENPLNNCIDNLEWCTQKYNCNYGTRKNKLSKANEHKKKKILQYDENYNYIKTYESVMEASRKTKIKSGNICNSAKKGIKAKGYYFKYV